GRVERLQCVYCVIFEVKVIMRRMPYKITGNTIVESAIAQKDSLIDLLFQSRRVRFACNEHKRSIAVVPGRGAKHQLWCSGHILNDRQISSRKRLQIGL